MLKFFRRLRQNIIIEKNFGSYLTYAFGEILLVMIGILLALQVNSWNQNRIDKKKEANALIDLSKEFRLNQARIKTKQTGRETIVPGFENFISLISAGNANHKIFEEIHSAQFLLGMTNPSHGVIDALISSGDISLISNESLKYLLADWKNQAEDLRENEQILWDIGIDYVKNFTLTVPDPRQHWDDWSENKLEESFEMLISSIEYRNKLINFHGANKIIIERCNEILDILESTLKLLDDEINKGSYSN